MEAMVSIAKKRIKDVFIDSLLAVRSGKTPNVQRSMIRHGYSVSSARANKVTQSKTWVNLKAKYLKDDIALQTFNDLAQRTNDDKDNRLRASIEIMKLNDRYPAQTTKVLGLFQTLETIEE